MISRNGCAERTRNLPEPEVSDEFLRRSAAASIAGSANRSRTWISLRWALSLAMLLLMLAGGLTLELRHKAAPHLGRATVLRPSAMEQRRAQSYPADPRIVQE